MSVGGYRFSITSPSVTVITSKLHPLFTYVSLLYYFMLSMLSVNLEESACTNIKGSVAQIWVEMSYFFVFFFIDENLSLGSG